MAVPNRGKDICRKRNPLPKPAGNFSKIELKNTKILSALIKKISK